MTFGSTDKAVLEGIHQNQWNVSHWKWVGKFMKFTDGELFCQDDWVDYFRISSSKHTDSSNGKGQQ